MKPISEYKTLAEYITDIKPQYDFNGRPLMSARQRYYSFGQIALDYKELLPKTGTQIPKSGNRELEYRVSALEKQLEERPRAPNVPQPSSSIKLEF